MRWVAGIDVGNATTEIVLADMSTSPPTPVAWDRTPTRGRKGSALAISNAVELLARMERMAGVTAEALVMAPQSPVDTRSTTLADPPPDTGRLVLLASGRATPSGRGSGVGRPVAVEREPDPSLGPVVLVARDPLGFRATSARVREWVAAGCDVVGVLLAGDEAVLVSSRLPIDVPVVDQALTALALSADAVALEVGGAGRPVRQLADPVHLTAALGLAPAEHRHAEALARSVRGLGDVAVAVLTTRSAPESGSKERAWMADAEGRTTDLLDALRSGDPRRWTSARTLSIPADGGPSGRREVDDLWAVDLTALAHDAVLRPDTVRAHAIALATLTTTGAEDAVDQALQAASSSRRRVLTVAHESDAARAGALSTPSALEGALVVDIGGGTIDVVLPDGTANVLAGAGDLVSTATAVLLGIPGGQAEWVKRGPCARVESPHVLVEEDGNRRFLKTPAATGSVGWLVVPGPAGPLAFDRVLAPSEWRSLRIRLKRAVLGDNMARGGAKGVVGDVIVVGGPAGDDEVLDVVARALPGAVPGRGDVAGVLGHRWAVAWGLVLLASRGTAVDATEPRATGHLGDLTPDPPTPRSPA